MSRRSRVNSSNGASSSTSRQIGFGFNGLLMKAPTESFCRGDPELLRLLSDLKAEEEDERQEEVVTQPSIGVIDEDADATSTSCRQADVEPQQVGEQEATVGKEVVWVNEGSLDDFSENRPFTIYRHTIVGDCLFLALNDLIEKDIILEVSQESLMRCFDQAANEVAIDFKSSRLPFSLKGCISSYSHIEGVWDIKVKNAKLSDALIRRDMESLRIVAADESALGIRRQSHNKRSLIKRLSVAAAPPPVAKRRRR